MNSFCDILYEQYCLHEKTFHQDEYSRKLEAILFHCRNIERLRLVLPYPLVGRHDVATWMLAITFRALGQPPEPDEESARLRVLVLENVSDTSICQLWRNPVDIKNIRFAMGRLKHLIITTRRRDVSRDQFEMYSVYLWDMIRQPDDLESLCLMGTDTDLFDGQDSVKHTKPTVISREQWNVQTFPCPANSLFNLTRLELKNLDLHAGFFHQMAKGFGRTLQELYLNSVALKVSDHDIDPDVNAAHRCPTLWVGLPDHDQLPHYQWIAPTIRTYFANLRICRAVKLGYDFHGTNDQLDWCDGFDLKDPCGLERNLGQRFVEVVMGFEQPPAADDQRSSSIQPPHGVTEEKWPPLIARPKEFSVQDWSTTKHQEAVGNSTSRWARSLDGMFFNANACTVREMQSITLAACNGFSNAWRS